MKKLLLIALPLLLIVVCQKDPINYETTLIERDGFYYTKDTNQPYSGPVFSLDDKGRNIIESNLEDGEMISYKKIMWYEDGKKKSETTYKDGKKDGLFLQWYENGKKQEEGTFKDGQPDGLLTLWYENGQKKQEGTYKKGKKEGLFTFWYENGQKKGQGTFRDGDIIDGSEKIRNNFQGWEIDF